MKRWLAEWSVNEDEPTWLQVAVAGVVFVLALAAMYGSIWLIAAAMGIPA